MSQLDYFRNTKAPKTLTAKELVNLCLELKELIRVAKMEGAQFGSLSDNRVDTLIKDETRPYRETWLIYPLEVLLDRYELALTEMEEFKKRSQS